LIDLFVIGIGVRGDGFDGWQASRAILAGQADYMATPAQLPPPIILPPNERRRAGPVTRLALALAGEATESARLQPASARAVFGSANGDGITVEAILASLASDNAYVSPTQFHNSVHNAAAGYWTIGVGSSQPVTCVGCHDFTAGATLLAAAAEMFADQRPVLMCVYDVPLPEPLASARPCSGIFGTALVLAPTPDEAIAHVQLDWRAGGAPPGMELPCRTYGGLPWSNPAARTLRLLEAIAEQKHDHLALPLLGGHVGLSVQPCSTATR
jgi:hypothetical protein